MRNSQDDVYLTLRKASEGEAYKEKGSKFLAYAYPLTNSDGVEDLIQVLKKAHPNELLFLKLILHLNLQ